MIEVAIMAAMMGDGHSSETKNTEVDNQNPDIDPGENDFRSTSRHVMLIVATGPHDAPNYCTP
jgi:hypothetical protein